MAPTDLGSVRVVNRTSYRQRMLAKCGAVFPPGLVIATAEDHCILRSSLARVGLQGWPSFAQAFGERWPDGSVRHARLFAVPRVAPHSDEMIPLGPAPELPFVLGEWCGRLAGMIAPRLVITKADGSRIVSPLTTAGVNLAQGPAGIVSQMRQRIPGTCLWWSLRTEIGCDSDAVRFRLRVHNSDPSRPAVREDFAAIHFESDLPAHFWLWEKLGLVPERMPGLFGPDYSFRWRLSAQDHLADAQGLWCFDGVFPLIDPAVHPGDEAERIDAILAAREWPLEMQHDGFREPGRYGQFGNPGRIAAGRTVQSVDTDISNRADAFQRSKTQIARWGEWSYSEFSDTARTGEHPTHGTSLMAGEILTCNPRWQMEGLLGCLGQARRPLYRYEADLGVVLKRNHPNLLYWSGNVHGPSQDRLGKGTAQATEADKHWWSGPDPEHWMMEAFLGPIGALTGDWDVLELGRHHMEQFKGHGHLQLLGFATRAQAWCSYAMSWWRLLLGEAEDKTWVTGWQAALVQWHMQRNARGEGGWGMGPGPVRPTIVMKDERYFWSPAGVPLLPNGRPDPALLQPFWIVWQHHFFVWGVLALHQVQPHAGLWSMLLNAAKTVDMHGWDPARRHPFGGVAWFDGGQPIPQPPVYVQDVWDAVRSMWTKTPGTVTSDAQTDWLAWAAGAIEASEHLATAAGDATWLARLAEIRTWVQAFATSQQNRDKLARWTGTMPQAAPVT